MTVTMNVTYVITNVHTWIFAVGADADRRSLAQLDALGTSLVDLLLTYC